jgi:hypothetical protein
MFLLNVLNVLNVVAPFKCFILARLENQTMDRDGSGLWLADFGRAGKLSAL